MIKSLCIIVRSRPRTSEINYFYITAPHLLLPFLTIGCQCPARDMFMTCSLTLNDLSMRCPLQYPTPLYPTLFYPTLFYPTLDFTPPFILLHPILPHLDFTPPMTLPPLDFTPPMTLPHLDFTPLNDFTPPMTLPHP